MAEPHWSPIGEGVPAYRFAPATGTIRRFGSPSDVIESIDADLESVIALVQSGGTTFLSPILGRLGGIVCRDGTLRSHLAIVSREFEVPCLVGTRLSEDPADGSTVRLEIGEAGDGLVWAESAQARPDTDQIGPARIDPARIGSAGSGVVSPRPGSAGPGSAPADPAVTGPAVTGPASPGGAAGSGEPGSAGSARPDPVPPASGTTGEVSRAWWSYIRRVGDEIAVKDFDVEVPAAALEQLISERLTDERLDALIGHMGRSFKPEMTRRSTFTSELFPMMPYIAMSMIEDFHSYPARIAAIEEAMPAEEIGRRLRAAPGLVSPLWIWMVGYHYLCGRECLIRMGRLVRDQRLDEVRTVVDFWRRLSLAHRGDGTLDYKDAGFTNRYLPADQVERLAAAAAELDSSSAKALKRLNATVAGYSFLYFCDSRVGVCDSGPYPRRGGRHLLVRDYLSLGPSSFGYPWAATLRPPYRALTLVLEFDPSAFSSFEINDWGTTFSEPDQLLALVDRAAVIGHRPDGVREPVRTDGWARLTDELSRSHLELYQHFADQDRQQRIMSATRMYTSGLRPFAAVAGVTDRIDWSFAPRTLALYPDPLDDDDRAAAIFGGAVVENGLPGSFSPIHPLIRH